MASAVLGQFLDCVYDLMTELFLAVSVYDPLLVAFFPNSVDLLVALFVVESVDSISAAFYVEKCGYDLMFAVCA